MVASFFQKASAALRGKTLAFVGRALHATDEEIPAVIVARLRNLWEWRLRTARTAEAPDSHTEELTQFGWWFISGKFDDRWAMAQLREALELARWAEPDHLVVERLAELTPEMPRLAVSCFILMAESGKPAWHLDGWRGAPTTILEAAIKSSDQEAKEAAIDQVHRLGARGYLGFRDLLPVKEG